LLNHPLALYTKRIFTLLSFLTKYLGLLYLNLLNRKPARWYICLFLAGLVLALCHHPLARAQTNNQTEADYLGVIWLVVAGALVFFMNAGFAMLEAGLCQTRNAINVLAKNLIVFCVSIFAFWWLGFGIMFGDGNSLWGQEGFFFQTFNPPFNNDFPAGFEELATLYAGQSFLGIFFFQLVFAGTAATIVSGAVAERIKFWAFFWFSFCLIGIAYPITGRWVWGPDGWLASNLNFLDFAGSTVVHSVGGTAGLLGTMLLGPRRGWQGYDPNQIGKEQFTAKARQFTPYNLTFSTLGCLILWLGWLGFNGGSVKAVAHIPHVITTTIIAAASGGVFVLLLRGLRRDKPPLPLAINGILGGLVGITASSAYVTLGVAMFIGAVSGLCVILVEALLEFYRIDDPVGAVPVHLGCGIWGTLAVGLFVNQLPPYIEQEVNRVEQILGQLVGILSVQALTIILCLLFWLVIGMILYLVELCNEQLKRAQAVNQPANNLAQSNTNKYKSENLIPESPLEWLVKYLKIAREALRVSVEEEMRGSDGTFTPL
jgi:Amt family ammonium transporter